MSRFRRWRLAFHPDRLPNGAALSNYRERHVPQRGEEASAGIGGQTPTCGAGKTPEQSHPRNHRIEDPNCMVGPPGRKALATPCATI